MPEKKPVAKKYHVRLHAVFSVDDFLHAVDDWIIKNHFTKELKDQAQLNRPEGGEVKHVIECWKPVHHHAYAVVRMHALFTNLKDITVEKRGKKRAMQEADVDVSFDGFIESHFAHGWANKPLYHFIRGFAHTFFYKNIYDMFDHIAAGGTASLYQHVRAFFIKPVKPKIP